MYRADEGLPTANVFIFSNFVLGRAVATGGEGAVPSNSCFVPPFRFTQNTVYEISRNDKTTDNGGKMNNNVQA